MKTIIITCILLLELMFVTEIESWDEKICYGLIPTDNPNITYHMSKAKKPDSEQPPFILTIKRTGAASESNITDSIDMKPGEQLDITINKTVTNISTSPILSMFLVTIKEERYGFESFGTFKFADEYKNDLITLDYFFEKDNAIATKTNISKSSLQQAKFTWTAPHNRRDNLLQLKFYTTYVENNVTFWIGVEHNITINISGNADSKSSSNTWYQNKIEHLYGACNAKKIGCMGINLISWEKDRLVKKWNCVKDYKMGEFNKREICKAFVSWRLAYDCEGNDRHIYHISGPEIQPGGSAFVAMGFSVDPRMGSDSIAACLTFGGEVNMTRYITDQRNSYPPSISEFQKPYNYGLIPIDARVEDGFLSCDFEQINHEFVNSISVKVGNPYYIIMAFGTLRSNQYSKGDLKKVLLRYHERNKGVSKEMVDIISLGVQLNFTEGSGRATATIVSYSTPLISILQIVIYYCLSSHLEHCVE